MLPPLVIRPDRRVISCNDLIELLQLPTPLTSEVDKKRRNNLESVLPSQRSTEIPGRSSQPAVLTVSPSFHLGRCKSALGITLECVPRTLASDTIAAACRPGDSRRQCERGRFSLEGDGYRDARYGLDDRGCANSFEVAAHGSFSAAQLRANRLSSAAVGRLNLCLIFSQCVSTVLRLR